MKIPKGMTEAEVLDAIEKAVEAATPGLAFGPFSDDDIKQEARLEALRFLASDKYKDGMPLVPILYRHMTFRLNNFHRNNNRRSDAPCKLCYRAQGPTGHPDGKMCEKFRAWKARNDSKSCLKGSLAVESPGEQPDHERPDEVASDEIFRIIDETLPVELRATYLRMKAGENVPKAKRDEVLEFLKEVLCQRKEED